MRPVDPALKLRPETLDRVDCRAGRADIFLAHVVHRLVPVAQGAKRAVAHVFVGMDLAIRFHVSADDRHNRRAAAVRDNLGHDLAAMFQHPENDSLAAPAHAASGVASDERFIDLDALERPAHRIVAINRAHVFADLVAHAPRSFVGHAKLALDLFRRNAVPTGAELEHHEKPVAQRGPRAIKRRASGGINLKRTPVALIGATGLHTRKLGGPITAGAREIGAVAGLKKVIETHILGRKLVLKLAERGGFVRHAYCVAQ